MPGKRLTRKDRAKDGGRDQEKKRSMTVEEILDELRFFGDGTFPRTALKQAVTRRTDITPELLRVLEDAAEDPEGLPDDTLLHIYAMFLLAQFREERAYPVIVDFVSVPGELIMDLCGDTVTEDLGRILASVSGGDPSLMKSLVEDEEVNEYVRAAALTGMLSLVVAGEMSRRELVDYLRQAFHSEDLREEPLVSSTLVVTALRLHAGELYEEIKEACTFDEDEFEPVSLDYVERTLSQDRRKVLQATREDSHHQLVEDVVSEIEWWVCFEGDR
jgi:hypothetical protein